MFETYLEKTIFYIKDMQIYEYQPHMEHYGFTAQRCNFFL